MCAHGGCVVVVLVNTLVVVIVGGVARGLSRARLFRLKLRVDLFPIIVESHPGFYAGVAET